MIPIKVPIKTTVVFYLNGKKCEYQVWPCGSFAGWYYWQAAGNGGKEPGLELAQRAARRWLRDKQ